jgi:hypothetical protein
MRQEMRRPQWQRLREPWAGEVETKALAQVGERAAAAAAQQQQQLKIRKAGLIAES